MNPIRALVLTDVVGSTDLAQRIGDAAMAAVWAAHDRAARDLLRAHDGREIDKTDGMLMLFERIDAAAAFTLAYQAALDAMTPPLAARAGVHVGPVILRENSAEDVARGAKPLELDGLAKPTVARCMAVAAGGQILLTADAQAALGATDRRTVSHGHWALKGIEDPVELFELARPGRRCLPPPDSDKAYRVVRSADWWLPVRDIAHNLPFQATSFVGRERELDEIKALFANARLVTLLGMGGLGKTRLSLQVAAESIARYPDGAWFVDLAPLRDPALVVAQAAQVFDLREEPGRPLLQTLCAHLRSRRALLVIDNCEHLVAASAQLIHAVLGAAPHVQVIASSREVLHVPGEQGYPILPLPLPRKGDDALAVGRSAAVRLFVDRARAHKPSFVLDANEAAAVAELVQRLEGIPLALELAAARVRALSVADINRRLADRFKLLVGGDRVLQTRQQTLRALVDWSYNLLDAREQSLLERLACFAGGFELDAAEAVCAAEPIDAADVLDLLQSLVEKSLVMHETRADRSRYALLDTIREYAAARLAERGDRAGIAERHAQHYFGLAKLIRDGLRGAEQGQWIERGEDEIDNLRAALALALAGGTDPFIAVKLCVALQNFWILRGYTGEGRSAVQAALALPAVAATPMARGHALYVGATLAEARSDPEEACRLLETCLELRRGLDDPVELATTLSMLGAARLQAGDPDAAATAGQEALVLLRAAGHRIGEMIGLIHLGEVSLWLGDDEAARDSFGHALEMARTLGHSEGEGVCELHLGELEFEADATESAAAHFERSRAVCERARDKRGEAAASWWLARTELHVGRLASARSGLNAVLPVLRTLDMRNEVLCGLEDAASLFLAEGAAETAASLAAAACTLRERLGLAVRAPRSQALWQARLALLHPSPTPAPLAVAWEAGTRWDLDQALAAALAGADAVPGRP